MPNDFVKKGYDIAAEKYATGRSQFKNINYLERLNSMLLPKSRILDIGCGAGEPVDRYFVEHGHSVVGIDISDKMIALAKKKVPHAKFKVEDMSELKAGEYQVDAVVSFYAIFHTKRETHQVIFEKINSFLPQGGLLLVTMGSSDWEGKESDFHGVEMFWSHYDAQENTKLVKNAGFEIILDEIDTTGNEKHQVVIAEKL